MPTGVNTIACSTRIYVLQAITVICHQTAANRMITSNQEEGSAIHLVSQQSSLLPNTATHRRERGIAKSAFAGDGHAEQSVNHPTARTIGATQMSGFTCSTGICVLQVNYDTLSLLYNTNSPTLLARFEQIPVKPKSVKDGHVHASARRRGKAQALLR